jgi:hypothetical protein
LSLQAYEQTQDQRNEELMKWMDVGNSQLHMSFFSYQAD